MKTLERTPGDDAGRQVPRSARSWVTLVLAALLSLTGGAAAVAASPDLSVESLTAPAAAGAGRLIDVSYTVRNTGTVTANASWTDDIWLADKADGTGLLVRLDGNVPRTNSVVAAGSYNVTRTVALPNRAAGDYFVVVRSDIFDLVAEVTSTNNFRSTPLKLGTPDLVIESLVAPATAGASRQIDITITVKNIGTAPANANWAEDLWLASRADGTGLLNLLDGNISRTNNLGAGESYTVTRTVTMPNRAAGDYFVVARSDIFDQVFEAVSTNNFRSAPLALGTPDLVVESLVAPALVGAGRPIDVTYTVRNTGSGPASGSWAEDLWLASKADGTGLLNLLDGNIPRTNGLAAGDSYTVTRTVTVPNRPAGDYFIVVRSDIFDQVFEVTATNNIRGTPLKLGTPDLVVESLVVPALAGAGRQIEITYTVRNNGTGPANATWAEDLWLGSNADGTGLLNLLDGNISRTNSLAAGESYTVTRTVIVPNRPAGDYFVVVRSDIFDQVFEVSPTNNVRTAPLKLGTPDLVVESLTVPAVAGAGRQIEVSYTVKNNGLGLAAASWAEDLWLASAADGTGLLNLLDGNIPHTNNLAPGDSYTVTRTVTVPNRPAGDYFVVVRSDIFDQVFEVTSTNNVRGAQLKLGTPDLVVQNVIVPPVGGSGRQIEISYTVKNSGLGLASASWADDIWLADKADGTGLLNLLDGNISQTNSLAPDGTYTVTRRVTLPNRPVGDYFLVVRSDIFDQVFEVTQTNNVGSAPFQLGVAETPDLAAGNLVAPTAAGAGREIEVTYTVNNIGNGLAAATWADDIWLASSPDGTGLLNLLDGNIPRTNSVAPGGSYTVTRKVTVPNRQAGNYYLVARADIFDQVAEAGQTNNIVSSPLTLGTPDLSVETLVAPAVAATGQQVEVSYTVKNIGSWLATATWAEDIWLADQPDGTGLLNLLDGSITQTNSVAVDETYGVTRTVTIPNRPPGNYYIVVRSDIVDQVFETNLTNNFRSSVIAIGTSDLAVSDLVVTNAAGAGQTIEVTYTVKNTGTAPAPAPWSEGIWLAEQPDGTGLLDLLGGQIIRTNSLAPEASYTVTRTVTLPGRPSGNYFLVVRADTADQIFEASETNNIQSSPLNLGTADLVVESLIAPTSARVGRPFELTYTVKNTGTVAVPPTWVDFILLTTTPNAPVAVDVLDFTGLQTNSLAPGASYTVTRSVTVSNQPPGNYYIVISADISRRVLEASRDNNLKSSPLALGIPDLVVEQLATPATAGAGRQIEVSYTVTNSGYGTAVATWADDIWLAEQPDGTGLLDLLDGNIPRTNNMTADESYTVTRKVTVPNRTAGDYYLVVRSDIFDQIVEGNSTNNIRSAPFKLGTPDLSVESLVVPSAAESGQQIELSYTVKNIGSALTPGPWVEDVWLASNPDGTGLLDLLEGSITQTESLPVDGTYTVTRTVTVPNRTAGGYFVVVRSDIFDQVFEVSSTNNIRSVPLALGAPDLVVESLIVPGSAEAGQQIEVRYTVKNSGAGTAAASWAEDLWLATKPDGTGLVTLLDGNIAHTNSLAENGTYTVTRVVTVPNQQAGEYYVVVRVDLFDQVFEISSTNNFRSAPLSLGTPDLVVSGLVSPATAESGQQFEVSYTVVNDGAGTAAASWAEDIWLASKPDGTGLLSLLDGNISHTNALAPNGTYTVNRPVTLPSQPAGDYYVVVRLDIFDQVFEIAQTNNIRSAPLKLGGVALPVDLTITASLEDGTIQLSWPTAAGSYQLETKPSLLAFAWLPVSQTPEASAGTNRVTLPLGTDLGFFRLKKTP